MKAEQVIELIQTLEPAEIKLFHELAEFEAKERNEK
jgi:hypothetical protein